MSIEAHETVLTLSYHGKDNTIDLEDYSPLLISCVRWTHGYLPAGRGNGSGKKLRLLLHRVPDRNSLRADLKHSVVANHRKTRC
jgi:hypothetical protein